MPTVLPLSQVESVSFLREGVSVRQAEARAEAEASRKAAAAVVPATRARPAHPPMPEAAPQLIRPSPFMTHGERAGLTRARQLDEAMAATTAQRELLERKVGPRVAAERDGLAAFSAGGRAREPPAARAPPPRPAATGVAALLGGGDGSSAAADHGTPSPEALNNQPGGTHLIHGFGERPAAARTVDIGFGDAHARLARHHDSTGVARALHEGDTGGAAIPPPAPPPQRASGDIATARERYAALAAQPAMSRGHQQRSVVGQLLRCDTPEEPPPRPQTRAASARPAAGAKGKCSESEAQQPTVTRRRTAAPWCQPRSQWADVGPRYLQPRPVSAGARPASTSRVSRGQDLMHQRPGRLGAEREWQRADGRPRGPSRQAAVRDHFGAEPAQPFASSGRELNARIAGRLLQARSVGGMGWAGDPGWAAWAEA